MLVAPLSPAPQHPSVTFQPSTFPSPPLGYAGTNRGSGRSRTISRNRSLAVSVSLSKGVLSSQAAATTTGSPVIEEGTVTGSSTGDSDFLGAWSSFGLKNRSWTREVDTPEGSRGPSSAGGASSRQSRRSRNAPVDPPFVEGDLITPYQPLPAASSSAPLLPVPSSSPLRDSPINLAEGEHELKNLEIVRKLGTGSYAVVYLVREVLDQKEVHNDQEWELGELDEDEDGVASRSPVRTYGREFGMLLFFYTLSFFAFLFVTDSEGVCPSHLLALKCLSKHDLDEESLEVQMFEVCFFCVHPL